MKKYRCIIDGNQQVAVSNDLQTIKRKCLCFARRGIYTELWSCCSSGKLSLLYFWN